MKRRAIIIGVIIVAAIVGVFIPGRYNNTQRKGTISETAKDLYYCPMHPNFTSDKPGECGICGMSLVKREVNRPESPKQAAERKILYYRNPMNPAVTSPVPMKDQMGMDYVPVYEEETAQAQTSGVYISPEKQQLIGVKKGRVEKRKLTGEILTVGRVAYDPALFTAQQEYLQTFKSSRTIHKDEGYIDEQSGALIKSMKQKLLAMGMSEGEITGLEKGGQPQQNLYLPTSEDKNVWVYVTIYEYEAELVKTGTPIEVRAIAYPGEVFEGQVVSVTPILEAATRTLKVRALVDNTENKLKLEMFVNVVIKYDLGEKLAVPEEAVMHAGIRNIVFVVKSEGHFEPRAVTLGSKAQGYYEVLKGLTENEEVVTSGNFLIDSESKLNAGFNKAAEPNK
ncbi:MAG: efflux RND transporter periplasmic adaptor subunit [Sedimentisphaerales bacterium]|jgi:multidrug efflux pump subunit AcrA (membrane-fusion protein)